MKKKAQSKPRGPTKFRGITEAAAKLGVQRVSLWRALTGRWDLPDLVRRYEALRRQ